MEDSPFTLEAAVILEAAALRRSRVCKHGESCDLRPNFQDQEVSCGINEHVKKNVRPETRMGLEKL